MILIRFILILSLGLIVMGCNRDFGRDYHLDEESFDAESLKMVEQRTGLTLPAGSRGLNMFYQGSQIDPSFVAKIEIPAYSQEVLIKQIEQIHNEDGSVTGSLTEKVTWWNPSELTIQVERQFSLDMNYVRIIFCEENERCILYLEWIKI